MVLDKFSDLLTGLSTSILAPQTPTPYSIFFYPAASVILLNMSHYVSPLLTPSPTTSQVTQIKSQNSNNGLQDPLLAAWLLTPQAVLTLPLIPALESYWPSSKDPGKLLPQSLRFCCSPCLQYSVFRWLQLDHQSSSNLSSNVTFLVRPSLTTYLKWESHPANFHPPVSFLFFS